MSTNPGRGTRPRGPCTGPGPSSSTSSPEDDAGGLPSGHPGTWSVLTEALASGGHRVPDVGSYVLARGVDTAVAVSASQRRRAEDLWPVVAAAHQLAYRALALCWALERPGHDRAGAERAELLGEHAADRLHRALDVLARSVASGRAPGPLGPVPPALESELLNLHDCLSPVAPGDPARG